MFKNSSRCT